MIRRDSCRTLSYAVELFTSYVEQGFSPSLLVGCGEFVVSVWRVAPAVIAAILLQACTIYKSPISNEDLVKRAKVCHDAGLDIRTINTGDGVVLDFQCVPKGGK